MLGRTDWFDLPVADLADAMSFYEGLLGWTYRQMEDSPLSDYAMIEVAGKLIGGLRKVASPAAPLRPPAHDAGPRAIGNCGSAGLPSGEGGGEATSPILYFSVDKLAPKVARAKELGAKLVGETVDLGKDRGCYQWIRDREGNLIGLWAAQ